MINTSKITWDYPGINISKITWDYPGVDICVNLLKGDVLEITVMRGSSGYSKCYQREMLEAINCRAVIEKEIMELCERVIKEGKERLKRLLGEETV